MKIKYLGQIVLAAYVGLFLYTQNIVAATPPCGMQLSIGAEISGVSALSNEEYQRCANGVCGSCGGRGQYGLQYQCVEYIVRSATARGYDIQPWLWTNAVDFFTTNKATEIGMTRIVNGATATISPPVPNDIVVFDATAKNPYGHIAIVKSVSGDGTIVTIVEQNWSDSGLATLTRKANTGNRYELNNRGSYKILGWLRKPPPSTAFEDVLTRSSSFADPIYEESGYGFFRIDRFTNISNVPVRLDSVQFIFFDPEDIGIPDATPWNWPEITSAAESIYPDFDFWGGYWWHLRRLYDGTDCFAEENRDDPRCIDDKERVLWTNSMIITDLERTILQPGEYIDIEHTAINDHIPEFTNGHPLIKPSEIVVGFQFSGVINYIGGGGNW